MGRVGGDADARIVRHLNIPKTKERPSATTTTATTATTTATTATWRVPIGTVAFGVYWKLGNVFVSFFFLCNNSNNSNNNNNNSNNSNNNVVRFDENCRLRR